MHSKAQGNLYVVLTCLFVVYRPGHKKNEFYLFVVYIFFFGGLRFSNFDLCTSCNPLCADRAPPPARARGAATSGCPAASAIDEANIRPSPAFLVNLEAVPMSS
jgi:hypothetical protein